MQEYIFKEDTEISDFFDVQEMEFLGYDNNPDDSVPASTKKVLTTVKRNIVFCNDLEALVIFLKKERHLGDDSVIKIGIDGGRGSIKVMLTVHDPNEKKDAQKSPRSPQRKKRKEKRKTRLQKKYLNR